MASTVQITIKTDQVIRVMRTAGHNTTAKQAAAIGVDASTWFRLVNGHNAPSPKVIAGILRAFPAWPFDELFAITDADQPEEATTQVA